MDERQFDRHETLVARTRLRPDSLPARLQDGPRRDRVEAPGLALSLWPQHTTSPSIRQERTLRWFTASTTSGNRSDQSLPRRVISRMPPLAGLAQVLQEPGGSCREAGGGRGLGSVRIKNPGTQYEISVDGRPRTYRDRQDIALQTARFLKSRKPTSTVRLKDLQTGEEVVVAFKATTEPAT